MGGDSLSLCKHFNFHRQMPRINEDYSTANNSTRTVTPDCESVRNYLNLLPQSEQNTQDLGNADSGTVIGNNANESKISSERIGHSTTGENSPVEGHIFSQTSHVDTNTGITGISGTGHTINNYACPPEIIELIRLLIEKGGKL
jgi:hypothetical protein